MDPIYNPDNIALFEALYGKNLISLGGIDAIDNMFADLNISGSKALDVGFGLGGVAYHLAKAYHTTVTGIEVHPWMVKRAQANIPAEIDTLVKFTVYDENGEMPFANDSFDMVYSKGVFNHVHDKKSLFLSIQRVLKPCGLLVIADWICQGSPIEAAGSLAQETEQSYQEVLAKTGFSDISFRNDSLLFLGYVRKFIENMSAQQEYIKSTYGPELFAMIWQDHHKLIEDLQQQRKLAVRITARCEIDI
jgi:ubiquinone/menaquinone biosynthesis C-methylase UbiE